MADKFTGTITYNRLRNRETEELSYDNEFDPLQFYYEDELAKQRAKQAAINDFLDQDEEEPKRKKKKKKKKSKKKFFITLLVLLIIAGCAGGAYALFFAGNYQLVSVNLMAYMKEPTFSGEDKSGVLGNLDLDVKTKKLEINENGFEVNYLMILDSDNPQEFKYTVTYRE